MRKTSAKCYDVDMLEKRIAVSDTELAFLLGIGLATTRRIAAEAGAVCRIGKRKVNMVDKVKQYMNAIAGE